MSIPLTRRRFVGSSLAVGFASSLPLSVAAVEEQANLRLGLVTYLWGQDWDLPTLIANCEKTRILGLELRTQHKHGVEADLNAQERQEVRQRFDDSPVTFLGPGTNWAFQSPDRGELRKNIEQAISYVKLSHDCGGSGLKVKPNTLPEGVPVEKTIVQIGKSLNEVSRYAADYGQQIRVEVHGHRTQ